MKKIILTVTVFSLAVLFTGCNLENSPPKMTNPAASAVSENEVTKESKENEVEIMDEKFELSKSYKTRGDSSPVITQAYGADPYALVYGDTVYIYMTADAYEYDGNGEIKENSYSKIRSIHCVSTKDFKNFEDHGEIPVAGPNGIAKWASNSWAPAAAVKKINGKDKFFLYFADNGGGIGVLSADSPIGPFEDPLGHGLITRQVPTCDRVLWLFDPAVLVDDDGNAYIYFGGGVPFGKEAAPGTGRACKLGDDMISLDGDPVELDIPCLFEDSGIHKYNNKYYYTYCTNFSVPEESTKKYGFVNGQICYMVSDNPLGPFTFGGMILDNPQSLCGLGGNNHHAIFSFKDKYYIVYHSRQLEKAIGIKHGYRSTGINEVNFEKDGSIKPIPMNYKGPDQLLPFDVYSETNATCVSNMAGTNAVASDDYGYGKMLLGEIETGDYTEICGADFGPSSPKSFSVTAKAPAGEKAYIFVRPDFPGSSSSCIVEIEGTGEYKEYTANVTSEITGEHFLYFVYKGENFTVKSWKFNK